MISRQHERGITSLFCVEWFISCHSWLWLRQLQLLHKSSCHPYKVVQTRPFPFLVSCRRRQWKVRRANQSFESKASILYITIVFVIDPNENTSTTKEIHNKKRVQGKDVLQLKILRTHFQAQVQWRGEKGRGTQKANGPVP